MSLKVLITNKMFAINEVGNIKDNDKLIKKCRKLSKIGKLSKFQKSAKSENKLSKSRNLPNFDVKENDPSLFTFYARTFFKYLWFVFSKASILQYFDLKYYIWIEIDILSYAISGMLSQFTFEIKLNKMIIKTDLG